MGVGILEVAIKTHRNASWQEAVHTVHGNDEAVAIQGGQ